MRNVFLAGALAVAGHMVSHATPQSALQARSAVHVKAAKPTTDSPKAPTLADWCKRLHPRLPGISAQTCQGSGLEPSGAFSRKGFPVLARTFPAQQKQTGEAPPVRILLLGGIHGDELTAAAIVFQWLQWIEAPAARQFHWRVAPVVNPDGLLAPKPQRMNANGVDLNRNFPTPGWDQDAARYWARTTKSDPRRYPGNEPLSEPESRWLHDEMERFRPDVIISVHAPFGMLDLDGPAKAPRRFGRLYYSRVGVYPGSLGNYGGVHKNLPVITIELPHALVMPKREESRRIWQDMLAWIARSVPVQAEKGDKGDKAGNDSIQRAATDSTANEH